MTDINIEWRNAWDALVLKNRELEKVLKSLLDAFNAGCVQMSSAEIQFDDEHPPHPWHEEWLSRARAAVTSQMHSPPGFSASHNSGERLPSSDAAEAGGEIASQQHSQGE